MKKTQTTFGGGLIYGKPQNTNGRFSEAGTSYLFSAIMLSTRFLPPGSNRGMIESSTYAPSVGSAHVIVPRTGVLREFKRTESRTYAPLVGSTHILSGTRLEAGASSIPGQAETTFSLVPQR